MQWCELSAEEVAFLAAVPASREDFVARLEPRLARTLRARLRLPVVVEAREAPPLARVSAPGWEVGPRLATLWLSRRLGGRDALGEVTAVPRSLLRTLDAVLAECWLDGPEALPAALAWEITAGASWDALAVQLPHDSNDMTRWAREVIRHGS